MADQPYWNPRTETLPREDLQALQLAKLQRVVDFAARHSPYYRTALAVGSDRALPVEKWDDVRRLPFTTRAGWMEGQEVSPPYGTLVAGDPARAIRLHTTSGTTGQTPLRALDSRKDWAWAAEMWCYGLWAAGVRPGDVAYVAFGYGSFIGFWGLHYGLEKLGALVIPGGAQTTENRVRQIMGFGATVVATTPTYALRLAQCAGDLGLDLARAPVRTLILSGEPAGSIPETKRLIEAQWGASSHDTAGMTEINTIFMFECDHHPGGAHVIEDHVLEEVIDPLTEAPVAYGEMGERVVTSFGRSMSPLIRYRTSDLVVRVPADRCTCGRTFDIYEGGVLGRVDDMKVVRGTNVYPRAVESVVRSRPEIDEFQILITTEGIRDEIWLRCELHDQEARATQWPAVQDWLHGALAAAHEGLNVRVELADAGSLPRFELKAKRLVDLRPRARKEAADG